MNQSRYLQKTKGTETFNSEDELLRFLETLNQNDWMDLFTDLSLQPRLVSGVFDPPPGTSLLPYVAAFVDELGAESRRLIYSAVNELLAQCMAQIQKNDPRRLVTTLLEFSPLISFEPDVDLMTKLVEERHLGEDLRSKAALTLLSSSDLSIWGRFNYDRDTFLLPIKASAFAQKQPKETFMLLSKTQSPDREGWETPVDTALVALMEEKSGRIWLEKFLEQLNDPQRRIVQDLPSYQFWIQTLKPPPSKDTGVTKLPPLHGFPLNKIRLYYEPVRTFINEKVLKPKGKLKDAYE